MRAELLRKLALIESGLFWHSFALGVIAYFVWVIYSRVNDIYGKVVVLPAVSVKDE